MKAEVAVWRNSANFHLNMDYAIINAELYLPPCPDLHMQTDDYTTFSEAQKSLILDCFFSTLIAVGL